MVFKGIAQMRRGSKRCRLGILAALIVMFGAVSVPASATPITITFDETPLPGGDYYYEYEVFNTGELGQGFNIYDVFFPDLSPGTVVSITSPSGWDSIPTDLFIPPGTTFVDAFSLSSPFDILAGSSLGGFGFTLNSQLDRGNVPFEALFVFTPVPEPTTVVLLGVSIAGLLARRKVQNSRRKLQQT